MMPPATLNNADGPLTGIRVIGLTRILSEPMASMMLADRGAEVIKVEDTRSGDSECRNPPITSAGAGNRFGMLNRNNRGVALDFKHPDGREALLKLIDSADVVREGFRPVVANRHAIGHSAASARKRELIHRSLSGFGQGRA